MERLTKRDNNGNSYFRNKCFDDGILDYGMIIDRLAELEDKLESGELLELPCKVGDTVYVVYKDEWEYSIYVATAIGFYIDEEHGIEIITDFQCYPCDRIGNFTTKEAAEARLKELQEQKR